MAKLLILMGLLILTAGLILYFFPHTFRWLGNLPGDITIERENFLFKFPLMTCILFSAFFSFILWILKK